MAYCTWANVVEVFPEAGDIEADGADQTALVAAGTSMTDTLLGPYMRTPIQYEEGGATYPQIIVQICALLTADAVAWRRLGGEDEAYVQQYGNTQFTMTKYGHRAMAFVQALAAKQAATADEITGPDVVAPLVVTSFTTTDGTVLAQFAAGLYERDARSIYKFTVSSTGGTVDADTLKFTVKRDREYDVYPAASPLSIAGSGWHDVEYGLQIRCIDNATTPTWTLNETFTVTCESGLSKPKTSGPRVIEVHRG